MAMRSVALVGGAGFIGSNLTRCLIARGWRVAVYDKPGCKSFLPEQSVRSLDISDPREDFQELLKHDAIVLLAALLGKECEAHPETAWSVNVWGSMRLLNVIKRNADRAHGARQRLIFLSSGVVYDGTFATSPYHEGAPTAGSSLYACTKLAIENAVRAATRGGAMDALVLRPFTVFGPFGMRGAAGHFLGRWLEQVAAGAPLTIHGDGNHGVDLVSVDEVTAVIAAYVEQIAEEPLTVLNVSSGMALPVREIAAMFSEVFGDICVEQIPPPTIPSSHGWGDTSALIRFLGRPTLSSRDTLHSFLEGIYNTDYRRNQKTLT